MKSPSIRCPVSRTLHIIGGKWKPLILFHIGGGVRRNGALRRAMPEITQKMLTEQLRELETDGVVTRTVYPVVPPRVDYTLTDFGKTLKPVLDAMAKWGLSCQARFPAEKGSAS